MTDESVTSTQHLQYIDHQFLMHRPLTIGNFIDEYFCNSPFYDNQCLNQLAKFRNEREISDLEGKIGFFYKITYVRIKNLEYLNMNKKPGDEEITEKILVERDIYKPENLNIPISPGFCEVSKIENFLKDEETVESKVLAKYYAIDGFVYQSPDLHSILASALRSGIFYMREAVREIETIFEWNPRMGYYVKQTDTYDEPPFIFDKDEYNTILKENEAEATIQKSFLS
jgi:hypothetical protein